MVGAANHVPRGGRGVCCRLWNFHSGTEVIIAGVEKIIRNISMPSAQRRRKDRDVARAERMPAAMLAIVASALRQTAPPLKGGRLPLVCLYCALSDPNKPSLSMF